MTASTSPTTPWTSRPSVFAMGSVVGTLLTLLLLLQNAPREFLKLDKLGADEETTPTSPTSTQDSGAGTEAPIRRRVFVDCGANVASSVDLFRVTYPEADTFEIYSFEIDARLRPYFAGIPRHRLFCPVAIAANGGNVRAYLESPWTTTDRLRDGKEMHWGGGTLFPFSSEALSLDGGQRNLGLHVNVSAFNLADWLIRTFSQSDEVILKLDVEGAEFAVLEALLETGADRLVDKWYGEFHEWAPGVANRKQWRRLKRRLMARGIVFKDWAAESLRYEDMEDLNLPEPSLLNVSGIPGELLTTCRQGRDAPKSVSLVVAIGMNPITSRRLVATLRSFFELYPGDEQNDIHLNGEAPPLLPVTLFVYSDFARLYSNLVAEWAMRFIIATRGERPWTSRTPSTSSIRKSLVTSSRVFSRQRLQPSLVLADTWNVRASLLTEARRRGLRVIRPTVSFPPLYSDSPHKLEDVYSKVRSVERTPKALRFIHDHIRADGGIVALDADDDDARLVSVFLLQHLRADTNFRLRPLERCF